MNFKPIYTSNTVYIILLITGITLLLFTTSMAYRQFVLTQKSAENVEHSLRVYNALGDLTTHYTKAKSEELRTDLQTNKTSQHAFQSFKSEGNAIIDTLKILTKDNNIQSLRLKPLSGLIDKLHDQLVNLELLNYHDPEETAYALRLQKSKIRHTLNDIESIKNRMLKDEERYMLNRETEYALHKSLTPTMLLSVAFIALLIFILSFFRLYFNKFRIKKSEAFLKSVLSNTDNIVNYYEPVFNKDKQIIDFKIVFANECNREYLGLEPDKIIGKTVLNEYPFFNSYNELLELIKSYSDQTKIIFDRQALVDNKKMRFQCIATPLSDGVLVTSRNTTPEEEAKEMEIMLKKRLENQNLMLLDNAAFLTNIFKSISDVVMHFKSIRDTNGKIIDFEILFINEKITSITADIPEEVKNKKISEVYPLIFNSDIFERLVAAVENGKPTEYETPFDDGNKTHWFHGTAIKLGDGVTVTVRDITEKKERENEIIELNEELTIHNSILIDAERIGKSGSFFWYLGEDVAVMSDNFYTMLGYEPNEFEFSFERFREFIHPEDMEAYLKDEKAIKGLGIQENIYRVITKHGEIKHFKANGQFIFKNGKKVMIGVVQDVTQSILVEEMLLKTNLDLKNSNSELESFSRVASHDLQEPLRKIQLFILRIEELDGETLSDKSKEYFQRVISAVKRMQSLIENLLAFSRIDSSTTNFEKIDLNQILLKIMDDLATTIHDTDAKVISNTLPTVNGVVFQMEQLFTNLVSNALKYRNSNQAPKIQITYSRIETSDLHEKFMTTARFYHKISIVDNGIGFDSQHAEKIFEVFQRLHQKTDYSGTGIGLAICRKIVDNHNGFIHAKGDIGVGSEFIIYLPETPIN